MDHAETTKQDLEKVIKMLNEQLGGGRVPEEGKLTYAAKNPDLIMFLMRNIQEEKERAIRIYK